MLKGANSVIATPEGCLWQLAETSPFSARAGFGDVLSGFVSGIGAIGLISGSNFDNQLLVLSALLHSYAGSSCLEGTRPHSIPKTLSKLVKNIQQEKVRFDTFPRPK